MPVMSRRRPPVKRTSSSSSSSSSSPTRRNANTKNLITASVFGGLELGGFLRAILLGAFVGGLVIFLFYPDITALMERWQNSSEQPAVLRPSNTEKGSAGGDARLVDVNKNDQKIHPQAKRGKRGDSVPEARKLKPEETEKENSRSSCQCSCQKPVQPPSCQRFSSAPKKPTVDRNTPEEDLMEEEETEVEEEDPVEVELMEEEEPVHFIELDPEEDAVSEPTTPTQEQVHSEPTEADKEEILDPEDIHSPPYNDNDEPAPKDSQLHRVSDQKEKDETIILTDGQPITFTPVNSGDESFIRVGGRPKPGKEADTQTVTTSKAIKATEPSSSTNSNASTQSSRNTPKDKASNSKQASSSKKKAPGKPTKDKESSKDSALPEEVKNFKPSFQRIVTAKKIFADGRRIPPVELLPQKETNSSVRVFLFNEFLSEAECDGLRRVHDKHVQDMASKPLLCFDSLNTLRKHLDDVRRNVRVTPNDFVAGTRCLNASFSRQLGTWMRGNWSYSTAFYPGESRFSEIFAARVERAMGLQPINGGKFQITSYPTGKAYKAHTDCVLEGGDPRDRVASVLVYLDDVPDGGETKFPELGIWVKPRKGRALVWNNMSPEGVCEPHSLHVASKVNSGSKYILIRWYYYKNFYSLGKRPPEPSLPTRAPGTPRVSCDDYDNGSCRWYDEWNNDHLLDYEYKKYTLI